MKNIDLTRVAHCVLCTTPLDMQSELFMQAEAELTLHSPKKKDTGGRHRHQRTDLTTNGVIMVFAMVMDNKGLGLGGLRVSGFDGLGFGVRGLGFLSLGFGASAEAEARSSHCGEVPPRPPTFGMGGRVVSGDRCLAAHAHTLRRCVRFVPTLSC